jgi:hypothetical protein
MRFNVGPQINQLTAIRNAMDDFFATVHSRGVEAAAAASTHAGYKEAGEERYGNHGSHSHRRNLHKVSILRADSVDQLNFEFARNKNSMTVLTICLRRVYQVSPNN